MSADDQADAAMRAAREAAARFAASVGRLRTDPGVSVGALEIIAPGIVQMAAGTDAGPWCPCGHGEDDICLNGAIYGNCGDENCGGGCDPDAGTCRSLPGCCDQGRRSRGPH